MIERRWSSYLDKLLYGHYFRVCHQIVDLPTTFHWLTRGDFTLETEGFLAALQDQAVTTRAMQHIFNSTFPSLCQLCGQHNETVQHLLSGWSVLAGGAYKECHDQVAINLHWHLCGKYDLSDLEFW